LAVEDGIIDAVVKWLAGRVGWGISGALPEADRISSKVKVT